MTAGMPETVFKTDHQSISYLETPIGFWAS